MSDTNIKERLLKFKKRFDPKLTSFFDKKISQLKKIDPQVIPLIEHVKDLTLRGGKRLRPAFLYYGFKACGGNDQKLVWPACSAIELLHSMALIHDDIMDNSNLRRGDPTVHKVLGVSGAILAGDLCFSWAEELFQGGKARKYWDLLKEEVILGQCLDINLVIPNLFRDPELNSGFQIKSGMTMKPKSFNSLNFKELEQKILKVLEYKTARYSVVRPLQIGAVLSGAKENKLKILEDYGLPLGIAFQIVDDILGIFGDEKTVGKPIGSDLKEGKVTLLIVKTISKLKAQSAKLKATRLPTPDAVGYGGQATQNLKLKRFLSLLGNKKATKKDLEWVRGIMRKTGALKYCQDKTKELAKQAKRAIKDYPFEKEAKEFLLGIADFIIERKY